MLISPEALDCLGQDDFLMTDYSGRLEFFQWLGSGNFGRVALVGLEVEEVVKKAALKIFAPSNDLLDHCGDVDFLERAFVREGQIHQFASERARGAVPDFMANLRISGVTCADRRNIDYALDPLRAIMMERIDGYTLNHRSIQLNTSSFVGLARFLLEQLKRLHGAGVLLRDVSSNNIMIRRDTLRGVFLDLGLAALKESEEDFLPEENADGAMGSPTFIAPEVYMKRQFRHEGRDLYGLGVLFHSLLANLNPFAPNTRPLNFNDTSYLNDLKSRICRGNSHPLPDHFGTGEEIPVFVKNFVRALMAAVENRPKTADEALGILSEVKN